MNSTNLMEPGEYSVFVLCDNGTWEQPTFRIDEPMSEHEFRMAAEHECGGFISFGVGEDDDCPPDLVRTFRKERAEP